MGIGVPNEVSMETASFADRHAVALVIIETVFVGRMGLHRGQQINYISRYRSKL